MPYRDKKQQYRRQIQWWIKRKIKAVEYLGGKCVSCGYSKCMAALHFHHKNPEEKEFMWGKLKRQTWTVVLGELDKCHLLCANCHAEEHFLNYPYS